MMFLSENIKEESQPAFAIVSSTFPGSAGFDEITIGQIFFSYSLA